MNLSLQALLDEGYLLDLNLRWAHPLGLSLEVDLDGAGRPYRLVVRDRRREPGGAKFDREPDGALQKITSIAAHRQGRSVARLAALGSGIQPIAGVDHGQASVVEVTPEANSALGALARSFGAELASSVRGEMSGDGDPDEVDAYEQFVAWLAGQAALRASSHLIAPLVSRLALDVYGRLHVRSAAEDAADGAHHGPAARVAFLLDEIPRLQAEYGELYPEEVAELPGLAAAVAEGGDVSAPRRRLEDLFGLAQQGMRFFRGDLEARARYLALAETIRAEAEALFEQRTEVERYIAGDLAAGEVTDPAAARRHIVERLDPMRERMATVEAELQQLRNRARPLDAALERLDGAAIEARP